MQTSRAEPPLAISSQDSRELLRRIEAILMLVLRRLRRRWWRKRRRRRRRSRGGRSRGASAALALAALYPGPSRAFPAKASAAWHQAVLLRDFLASRRCCMRDAEEAEGVGALGHVRGRHSSQQITSRVRATVKVGLSYTHLLWVDLKWLLVILSGIMIMK